MAESPSITSLFGDIVSPEMVRKQQEAEDFAMGKYMAENVGSAGMLNLPSHARNAMRSLGAITGAETRSPAEIKAAENQKLFNTLMQKATSQFPDSRSSQLNFVANELQKMGKTTESMKARDAAQASQLQEAKIYSEQAKGFASEQSGLKSQAETVTEKATRQGEVDKLAAEVLKQNALAAKAGKEKEKTAEEIATIMAERDPNIDLIEARTAAEQALQDKREAETKLKGAELSRFEAMTPLEILKANTEVAKNNTQTELNKARLGDVGMTEFTRNLAQLDATDEEKQKLLKQYTQAKAASGGVSGVRSKTLDMKLGIVEEGLKLAEGAQAAMDSAKRMVALVPSLTTGPQSTPRSVLNKYLDVIGIGDPDRVIADQLFDVLRGGEVLTAAGSLKGALSDKDLKFLQDTVANRDLNANTIVQAFASLYYERYADQKIAEHSEKLLNYSDQELRNLDLTSMKADYRTYYMKEAKGLLPLPQLN